MIITCGTCGAPRSTYGGLHVCGEAGDPHDVAITELEGRLVDAEREIEQLKDTARALLETMQRHGLG